MPVCKAFDDDANGGNIVLVNCFVSFLNWLSTYETIIAEYVSKNPI